MFRSVAKTVQAGVRYHHTNCVAPLRIGAKCEEFLSKSFPAVLADKTHGTVSIGDNVKAGKWTVLFTYPLDFTFVCPTEIHAFNDAKAEFAELNTEVIGASVDSIHSHSAWINTPRKKGGLGEEHNIAIIGDLKKEIGDYLNCTLDAGIYSRATAIFDDNGVLQHLSYNNLGVGRNINAIKDTVHAFQHLAKHGEVCPANFKGKYMKPTKDGLEAFFAEEK